MNGFNLIKRIYTQKTCKMCKKKFAIKGISTMKDEVTIIRWHDKKYCVECGNLRKKEFEKCLSI